MQGEGEVSLQNEIRSEGRAIQESGQDGQDGTNVDKDEQDAKRIGG